MQNSSAKQHSEKVNGLTQPMPLIELNSISRQFSENFRGIESAHASINTLSKMRETVAAIDTETTYVAVSEISFVKPIELTFTPDRPGFSVLTAKSSTSRLEYGYKGKPYIEAGVDNVLFMIPGVEVHAHCGKGTFRSVNCTFDPHYAEQIAGSLANLSAAQLAQALNVRSPIVTCLLFRLLNEALFPGPVSSAIVEAVGKTLLVECSHQLILCEQQQKQEGRLTAKHIHTIKGYLSGLTTKAANVAELAAACGYSERHFAKLFREQYGCSVSSYLKSVQISKAKAYLLSSELSLKEIAHRLGFSSLPHFSHTFREATGVTPGQFRKAD